jgi:hypothetical protein
MDSEEDLPHERLAGRSILGTPGKLEAKKDQRFGEIQLLSDLRQVGKDQAADRLSTSLRQALESQVRPSLI